MRRVLSLTIFFAIFLLCLRRRSKIKDAVREMRSAMQSALTARQSRLSITLPSGSRLGMEKAGVSEDTRSSDIRGDRELARCIASLFEGTGLSVCVLFATRGEMEAAVNKFGPLTECAFDFWTETAAGSGNATREKRNRRLANRQGGGFGEPSPASRLTTNNISNRVVVATAPGSVLNDENTDIDVYIIIAPRQASMAKVRQLCSKYGDEKLVILANARVDDMRGLPSDVAGFFYNGNGKDKSIGAGQTSKFEDVYFMKPDPSPDFAGGVLFRQFPDDWVLCRQSPVVGLVRLLESSVRPSGGDIIAALRAEAEKPTMGLLNNFNDLLGKRRKP
jgi:Domain of unknown function (DUF1995)